MKRVKSMTIKELEALLEEAHSREETANGRKKFKCYCGKLHTIKDCTVIQTHWYTPPRGCCEGDYWNTGELQIVCPTTSVRNRVMFETVDVEWRLRSNYEYDPAAQFSRQYKKLFKEVIDEHDRERGTYLYADRKTFNNYYFDQNHKKFGIKIGPSENS